MVEGFRQAARMRPRRIRINGADFAVRFRKFTTREGKMGICLHKPARLEIATGMTPFDQRDTMLHEVMHALLVKQGHTGSCFDKDETEEKYVNALATGIVGVLQDNPDFAQWLIEPLKEA